MHNSSWKYVSRDESEDESKFPTDKVYGNLHRKCTGVPRGRRSLAGYRGSAPLGGSGGAKAP